MRDFRDAKAMAQTLRESLTNRSITISHSESLELVSRMLGIADWNTLSALLPADLIGLFPETSGPAVRLLDKQGVSPARAAGVIAQGGGTPG